MGRSGCDNRACLEVLKALQRARTAAQVERSRLQSELDALGKQMLAHQSSSSPADGELVALREEGEELASKRTQLLQRLEALQGKRARLSKEVEDLGRRRERLEAERQREERRVEEARREALDELWNRPRVSDARAEALPPVEVFFAPGRVRGFKGFASRREGAIARYLDSAEGRLVDVSELRLRPGRGSPLTAPIQPIKQAEDGLLSELSPSRRMKKSFRLSSRSASGAGVFRGYTPSGSYTVPFRESPHWIPAGRSLEHGAGEMFASSLAESSLSGQSVLDPIHYDDRARARWGREYAVGRMRLSEERGRRSLSSAPGRLQQYRPTLVLEGGF